MTTTTDLPISKELLEILRCPLAVQESEKYGSDPGRLELVRNSWLVSADTGLKYPIRDGIPVMLIDEGMKWKETDVKDLPVPPLAQSEPSGSSTSSSQDNAAKDGGLNIPLLAVGGLLALVFLFIIRRRR